MGRRKGKAPQNPEGSRRPVPGERESGSASANSAPSRERRQGRGKARGERLLLEPGTVGGQETPGGRRKPTVEEDSDCRRPEAGPPPEAAGRQGSARRRGCGPQERRKPGDDRGGGPGGASPPRREDTRARPPQKERERAGTLGSAESPGDPEPQWGHVRWRRGSFLPRQRSPRGPGEQQPGRRGSGATAQLGANGRRLGRHSKRSGVRAGGARRVPE